MPQYATCNDTMRMQSNFAQSILDANALEIVIQKSRTKAF